jgi:5-methylcytosine-specific restriction enzyme subunit McrC
MTERAWKNGAVFWKVWSIMNDKGILIKNIFYMLSYAFQVLKQTNYERVGAEEFDHVEDLFAAVLERGISQQLKQGLYREYIGREDVLPTVKGKINLPGTIHNYVQRKILISCEYDELSEDNLFNQILKTTIVQLLRNRDVSRAHKQGLKKVLLFFENVSTVDPKGIPWNQIQIRKGNRSYEMLLDICRLALNSMIQASEAGDYFLPQFVDENMPRLYEHFILEYFRQHFGKSLIVSSSQVNWDMPQEPDTGSLKYLPRMQTDIMLRDRTDREKVLIIDAKYYTHTMQKHYGRETFHNNNLYQIFAYVKNEDSANTGKVAGMLLYAKTEEEVVPNGRYVFGGNSFSFQTLDLNKDFVGIAGQLDQIAEGYFPGVMKYKAG